MLGCGNSIYNVDKKSSSESPSVCSILGIIAYPSLDGSNIDYENSNVIPIMEQDNKSISESINIISQQNSQSQPAGSDASESISGSLQSVSGYLEDSNNDSESFKNINSKDYSKLVKSSAIKVNHDSKLSA